MNAMSAKPQSRLQREAAEVPLSDRSSSNELGRHDAHAASRLALASARPPSLWPQAAGCGGLAFLARSVVGALLLLALTSGRLRPAEAPASAFRAPGARRADSEVAGRHRPWRRGSRCHRRLSKLAGRDGGGRALPLERLLARGWPVRGGLLPACARARRWRARARSAEAHGRGGRSVQRSRSRRLPARARALAPPGAPVAPAAGRGARGCKPQRRQPAAAARASDARPMPRATAIPRFFRTRRSASRWSTATA